ncbi:respiratory nitrate reductase subunit gamma [Bordetella genomosp. 1]|uniref:Respiratory nitrate reductase subunit gamma n=1 Tax=Bordetella genomosp. 1 TaxID=1395607 RepID=A0ABX4EXR9_9BORD|nr:respiratory nitrate reductase subunit gamma [Bordetella genomosp. 1]MDQ8031349.1 respiratory nitrate reductase subunit gamma [Bordetella sp.]OZI63880.1 respiratory nitrate reductase subunit gamma [Bordetella genomosp. 1]
MGDYLHYFFFSVYPYIALTVFLLGSLARFDRGQYTWKSDSSQLLKRGSLRLGSNLFHLGIISLFFTHLVGLLTPPAVYHAFGVTTAFKQQMAIIVGAILGLVCLAGLLILIWRRWSEPRLRATSRPSDWLTLIWILIVLSLGLLSILTSRQHTDGELMVSLGDWAQHIVTFRSGAADLIAGAPWVYQVHMVLGMTLFVIFPFTRLVHVWSGFASVGYLGRAWQLVRSR